MPFKYADEEDRPNRERPAEGPSNSTPDPSPEDAAAQESLAAEVVSSDSPQAQRAQDAALRQAQDVAPWSEPQVQSQKIFREIFNAGGKTEGELEYLLASFSTTMGWADYWAREGFITEVISGAEKRFALSRRAMLELELA